jgi:hypothetical protein
MNLTPDIVRKYHRDIAKEFGFTIASRDDLEKLLTYRKASNSAVNKIFEPPTPISRLTKLLDKFGFYWQNQLKNTAMTLPISNDVTVVYLPYVPGSKDTSLHRQICTVSHEATHAKQCGGSTQGWKTWAFDYFRDFDNRRKLEVHAFHTSAEIYRKLIGKMPPSNWPGSETLGKYMLRPTDIKVFRIGLKAALGPLERDGALYTEVGKWGCAWLDRLE